MTAETLKEIIIKINQEDKKKAFEEMAKEVERFLNKWGNPHMTIIATQEGIEILQGDMAMPFKLKD